MLGLDTGYYRDGWLYSDNRQLAHTPETLHKDLRDITESDLAGCDAVAHLAELSNDPLGQNNPAVTRQINHKGSVALAEAAQALGIRRFVYTSSCSVYGAGTGEFLDETSADQPANRVCRVQGPRRTGCRGYDRAGFLPGVSAECDGIWAIAANALRHRTQRPFRAGVDDRTDRDGERWQSLAAARARRGHLRGDLRSLTAPEDAVQGKIFNVGQNVENYRVREIAEIVAEVFPGCEVTVGPTAATIAAIGSTSTGYTGNCLASPVVSLPGTVHAGAQRI